MNKKITNHMVCTALCSHLVRTAYYTDQKYCKVISALRMSVQGRNKNLWSRIELRDIHCWLRYFYII